MFHELITQFLNALPVSRRLGPNVLDFHNSVDHSSQPNSQCHDISYVWMGQLLDLAISGLALFSPHPRFKTSPPRSNPTAPTTKPPVFPVKTRVSRRLWRLSGRLTRGQGSAQDDAACASMHVHGRAGKPKQLARNANNPGKTFGFAAERTGTELFDVFPIFLKSSKGKIVGQRILDEISCLSRLPRQTPAVTDLNAMLSVASSRDHQRRP